MTRRLTDTEIRVLSFVARGRTNDEIGDLLEMSPLTAKKHVENAMAKMHVHTRAHAVYLAMSKGLIE